MIILCKVKTLYINTCRKSYKHIKSFKKPKMDSSIPQVIRRCLFNKASPHRCLGEEAVPLRFIPSLGSNPIFNGLGLGFDGFRVRV